MLNKLRRWLVFNVVLSGGLVALSGEWTSPIVWIFVAGFAVLTLYAMTATCSDLAQERFRPPTSGLDRVALIWIRLFAVATVVVAPLNGGRFHWTPPISDPARLAGVIGTLIAFAWCFHAMVVNRYFSAVIRIQDDR